MTKVIKIEKPKLAISLEETGSIYDEVYNEEKIVDKRIENTDISDINHIRVSVDSCIFRNVNFYDCDFSKIDLLDVVFENCDLSNINFNDSSIYRVEFKNCKLIGSSFTDTIMKNVLFKDCIAKYLSLIHI